MRAAVITASGGPEVLEVRDIPTPEPGEGHVRIRVFASALNRADLLQRAGRYPAPPGSPAHIPGIELAGEVDSVGPGVTTLRRGQRVFGIAGGGCHAEYVVVHERTVAEVPDGLGWEEAGAIPEAFITAHDAMWVQAGLRPSERVLVHAVGSGVGLAAVQLARAMNAVPFGTARTPEKIDRARAIGLEDGVALAGDFSVLEEAARTWTGGLGMHVALELVGGPYLPASIDALGQKGRLVLIGTMGGGRAEVDLGKVLAKRLKIHGTVLRSRPLEEKIEATRRFAAEVAPLFARGVLQPVIDRVFELDAIRDAHEYLQSNSSFGKVVLRIAAS